MNNIKTENLTIGYGKTALIGNLDLIVKRGEIVCLVGPNGAGKSTVLKTAAGNLAPLAGTVYIGDADMASMSSADRAQAMAAMLTGQPHTGYMTCFDVVSVGRYQFTGVTGRLSKKDVQAVEEALFAVGAAELKDKTFAAMSDGQKQRVLLARALCQEPEFIVLDEPTSYLDIGYKLEFADALKRMVREKNIGVLLSLHELEFVRLLADKVVSLTADNRVDRIGTPEQVLTQDYIETLYGMEHGALGRLYGGLWGKPQADQTQDVPACCTRNKKSKVKVLMVQGTMSSAGKSLIVAGLCRLFTQAGYRVRPFKSQNMALNSYVTADGLEMGRAQVMQAEACGVLPSVYMNPILLKPLGDSTSQVIVNGKVIGNMPAKEYFTYKKELIPQIKEAFEKLEQEADLIIIEGAGSPAEINLKENDIVNMGMAALVDAPVLLVGDIDRGGVFAQLLGTVDLLEKEERARVKGFVINKFRGDKSLLDSGLDMLKEKSGIPVAGVVPYTKHMLEDEDSLSERFLKRGSGGLVIGVVRLPHISNYTDFDTFEQVEGVSVVYMAKAEELAQADLVIIPGTKNTVADMQWLSKSGLAQAIRDCAGRDVPVIGICGGYQMLGTSITDPDHTEGGGSAEGLGLLPVSTVFAAEKQQVQTSGSFAKPTGLLAGLSGVEYTGYEIHMGQTEPLDGAELDAFTAGGSGYCKGSVYGTYVHGLFDRAEVLRPVLEALVKKKGMELSLDGVQDYTSVKEAEYDKLANILRENLDMELIYGMLGFQDSSLRSALRALLCHPEERSDEGS